MLAFAKSTECRFCWILPTLVAITIGAALAWIFERQRKEQSERAPDAKSLLKGE